MAHTSKSTARSKSTDTESTPNAVIAARKTRTSSKRNAVNPEHRQHMIAEAAYLRAEQRGFIGGDTQEDWLIAEREVDMLLSGKASSVTQ